MLHLKYRKAVLGIFTILALGSIVLGAMRIHFVFDFEQFFPKGDKDLDYFLEFREKFEADDRFLLVAVKRKEGVFEQKFLEKFHDFTLKSRDLPGIEDVTSPTKLVYPIKIPFGDMLTAIEAIHIDDTSRYDSDRRKLLADERMRNTLIDTSATTLVVAMKTMDNIEQKDAEILIDSLEALVQRYGFEEYHVLGRANFQKHIVESTLIEFAASILVAGILVTFVMFLIFRKLWGILVSVISIAMGLVLFIGYLAVFDPGLTMIAILFPVILAIVGTSDVIHVMSKYADELQKGHDRDTAIRGTMKEIGTAIFLTSATTAVGFGSIATSNIEPIKWFGINTAVGVMIAWATVAYFTTAWLSFFNTEDIIKVRPGVSQWTGLMGKIYAFSKDKPRRVVAYTLAAVVLCLLGIAQINTNYRVEDTLPRRNKVTADFKFFERQFSGFRPYEVAVICKDTFEATDFEVLTEMNKLEQHLKTYPYLQSISSYTIIHKSLARAYGGDRPSAYKFPTDTAQFLRFQRLASRFEKVLGSDVLVSKDRKHARISARVLDIGADSVNTMLGTIKTWADANLDSKVIEIRQTGSGVIIDKNAEYVRNNLLWGIGLSVLICSLMIFWLMRSLRMVIAFIVPNVLPLFLAGAIIGYAGISLEAGVSIVFSIIFGIAVDDTIHFFTKYRYLRQQGFAVEQSIQTTILETGKAMCLTSLTLFAGFITLLFSSYPPGFTIGLLISFTLLSALICDLYITPVMIRWAEKEPFISE